MPSTLELSAFRHWCDRRCESCAFDTACPVPRASGTMEQHLAEAQRMLERIATETRSTCNALRMRAANGSLTGDHRELYDQRRTFYVSALVSYGIGGLMIAGGGTLLALDFF